MSLAYSVAIYNLLYLALARQRDVSFVTDDRKLMRKLAGDPPFATMLISVADVG